MQLHKSASAHTTGSDERSSQGRDGRGWILGDVVLPFVALRGLLVFAGWFSELFVANPRYPAAQAARQGWQFTSVKLLDMWGRWDAGWYMDIVSGGYGHSTTYATSPSSIAFFPLFPFSVRAVLWLFGIGVHNRQAAMVIGVVISNLALLVALVAIRALVAQSSNEAAARRAVLYVLTFPTGFFLSSFYPESLFLAATALACLLATRQKWLLASLVGAIAVLSRPLRRRGRPTHGLALPVVARLAGS